MNWTRLIQDGSFREIRAALKDGKPPAGPNSSGYPVLHTACMRDSGRFRVAGWLLDAGVDVNQVDRARFKQTALHLAAEKGDLQLVERLLDAGAHPDVPDNWGNGPVWKALHTGGLDINTARRGAYAQVVRTLVGAGADLDRPNAAAASARKHLAQPWWADLADL